MVSIKKKVHGKKTYYYIEHSFRDGKRVVTREKYIGKTLPHDIESIKKKFLIEVYHEKWFSKFDNIKNAYSEQKEKTPPSAVEKDTNNFMIKFTYDTNRIEGSRLTYKETSLLLEKGITPNARLVSDVKEAEAHKNAFYEMLAWKKDISLETILYFHKKLFEQTKSDIAGRLREHQVEISGSRFMPPFPAEVYPLLMDFFKWYGRNRDRLHPVELAALVHLKLVTVHPFTDGNGRLSRLMMNLVLNKHGYPMLNISYSKRISYYNALEKSQVKKEDTTFLHWFFRRYFKEYAKYLKEP